MICSRSRNTRFGCLVNLSLACLLWEPRFQLRPSRRLEAFQAPNSALENGEMRLKKVLHAGRGKELDIQNGARITFHYKVESLSVSSSAIEVESELEDSRKAWPAGFGAPMELVLGKKFQLPIWETCLATMKLNEVASFDIDPPDLAGYPGVSKKLRDIAKAKAHPGQEQQHHHHCAGMAADMGTGYPELDKFAKNPTALRFTFELTKFEPVGSYEAEGWQLDGEERLSSVESLREKAKTLYSSGQMSLACETWKEALHRLDTLAMKEKPGEPEWTEIDQKKIPFYLNLAQAWLQTNQPYLALQASDVVFEATSEVLSRDPWNEKGLFRQARAKSDSWDLDGARSDLQSLLDHHPRLSSLVQSQLKALVQREKESKNSDVYKNMLK